MIFSNTYYSTVSIIFFDRTIGITIIAFLHNIAIVLEGSASSNMKLNTKDKVIRQLMQIYDKM